MTLTKDAKITLYKLYAEYRDRRKHGFSKSDSKNFGSAKTVQSDFFPELPLEDVDDSLRELRNNNFVQGVLADGIVYTCELSDYAIATLESLPIDTLASAADFLLKFYLPIIGH